MSKPQETESKSCESEKKPSWWKQHKTQLRWIATAILVSLVAWSLYRNREDLIRLKGLGIKPLLALFVLHASAIVINLSLIHI